MQQDGIAHAGVLATLADHSAGAAAGTLLEKNQMVLTAEFKINLLRAAKGDFLECHSKVLKAGKSLVVAESEIIDPKTQQLLAKAIVTMSVIIKR